MKKIALALALSTFALGSFAATGADASATASAGVPAGKVAPHKTVEEHKSKILERIDQHEKRLAEHKSCVQGAKTHEDLKNCKPARAHAGAKADAMAAPGGKEGAKVDAKVGAKVGAMAAPAAK